MPSRPKSGRHTLLGGQGNEQTGQKGSSSMQTRMHVSSAVNGSRTAGNASVNPSLLAGSVDSRIGELVKLASQTDSPETRKHSQSIVNDPEISVNIS